MKMLSFSGGSLLLTLSIFAAAALRSYAAPFQNGSFESPALTPGASVNLPAGSTNALTGWTVGTTGLVSFANGPALGISPVDGVQHIGFNGGDTPPGGSIAQSFSTLVGHSYRVGFYVGRIGSGSGTMSLHAEVKSSTGELLGSLTGTAPVSPGYSEAQTFTFTAVTDTSTLTFVDASTATAGVDMLLDNVSVAPVIECVQPPGGLVSWWKGEGDGNDAAGTNSSTLMSGITFPDGKVGQAFNFNGVDSQVRFGNTVGNFGTNDFTIDFWIRTTATRLESVIEKWPVCGHASMFTVRMGGPGVGAGKLNAVLEQDEVGSNQNSLISARQVNDGLFHHVALVRKSTSATFYIDGILDSTASSPGITRISNSVDLVAGRSVCVGIDGTANFTGQLDEISIYNRPLSLAEIQSIYNAGSAGKCTAAPQSCIAPPSGLVSWWPGESDASDRVDGNGGSLIGGVSFTNGMVGKAFDFNGIDGQISFGNTVGNFDTNDFTIDFWIRTTSTRLQSVVEKWPTCGFASLWYVRMNGSPVAGAAGLLALEMSSDTLGNDRTVVL